MGKERKKKVCPVPFSSFKAAYFANLYIRVILRHQTFPHFFCQFLKHRHHQTRVAALVFALGVGIVSLRRWQRSVPYWRQGPAEAPDIFKYQLFQRSLNLGYQKAAAVVREEDLD